MEQASYRLMLALKDKGHELSLLSLHPLGPLASELKSCGIDSLGLGYGQVPIWRWLMRLRRELKRQAPDALLLTGHSLPVLWGIAGYCRGKRILAIHFHHAGVKPAWFWRLYYVLAHQMINAVTFPSDFVRREALRFCPSLASKAFTLRNPIYPVPPIITLSERNAARDLLGLSADTPVIGNAGWLIERKRFDVFLHTAAFILRERPNARFLIAGDGPSRAALEALAVELDLAESLIWLGWITDIRNFYASLDLLLFNSDWDAMGLTPVEAAVHGIPVVSSVLNGGLTELLRPDRDAIIFSSHDAQALSAACLRLLSNPATAAAMAHDARAHVLSLCNAAELAEQHEHLLSGI